MNHPDWDTLATSQGVATPPRDARAAAGSPTAGTTSGDEDAPVSWAPTGATTTTDWGTPADGRAWGRFEERGWRQLWPFAVLGAGALLRLVLEAVFP